MLQKLNPLQETIVKGFIECGGVGGVAQEARGKGYTTALMYLAVQQTILTNRRVYFVTDMPIHYLHGVARDVARGFYGRYVSGTKDKLMIGGNVLNLVKPDNSYYGVKGCTVDDVFMDVSRETLKKHDEYFNMLQYQHQKKPGFWYAVWR